MSISSTLTKGTEFAGTHKLVNLTAAIVSASDEIALTEATHGISSVVGVVGVQVQVPTAGHTATGVTASGLTLTLTNVEQDGTAATQFGNVVEITVLGSVA